ncbi:MULTISPECIES: Uma2 family endonuclease [unclassified Streptomyces]|uniref:Uma2 family endonuclease n=1 Tax=unclassified Streptomyces TaxID=2593676 RepID=UPI00081EBC4C|nr:MULTISPECIES: Uma2 family endonuclease [unclassified Streptomyces]MYZ34472.1 Uma2 family endonuclease [Streptomyces sp. SID4917]SCF67614.1 Endonuclease, Uma2 family (restriction endonuclease fold) [Streptomyces sp. MnatMP-M17]
MTAMAEHAVQMSVEEFERLAKLVEKESDAVRLEFIHGRIGIKGMTDGDHSEIIRWLQERCMRVQTDLWLYAGGELGLQVEQYRKGRAKPDAVLAPKGTFAGQGDWACPERVLMTVEVTSYDSDTDRRDRKEKPAAYAAAGIPLYLLIDRGDCTITVHSVPMPDGYRYAQVMKFGARLALPDPVGIEFDTDELKDYVR